jgi:hypothetical protein
MHRFVRANLLFPYVEELPPIDARAVDRRRPFIFVVIPVISSRNRS